MPEEAKESTAPLMDGREPILVSTAQAAALRWPLPVPMPRASRDA